LLETAGDLLFPVSLVYAGLLADAPPVLSWLSLLAGMAVLAAAILGYRHARFPGRPFLGALTAAYCLLIIVWPWPVSARFLVPILPVFIILVGEHLRRWPERWDRARTLLIITCISLHVMATLAVVPGGTLWTRVLFPVEPSDREEITWMKNSVGAEDIVFSGLNSQWLSRELRHPVLGLNTLLSPSSALKMTFQMDRLITSDAREFERGLADWKDLAKSRNGRVMIYSDFTLNARSRNCLELLQKASRIRVIFEREESGTKVFLYEAGQEGGTQDSDASSLPHEQHVPGALDRLGEAALEHGGQIGVLPGKNFSVFGDKLSEKLDVFEIDVLDANVRAATDHWHRVTRA
jgi:hypothetical protein